jgi:hypothetical protein
MSKIALSGNASGTGTLTIAAPNTDTDRTLTLPDNTGTIITTGSTFAGTGPAFSAYLSANTSALSAATWTKITSDTEEFDTNNNYASGRFTPTVAGYYQITAASSPANFAGNFYLTALYKNGVIYKNGNNFPTSADAGPTSQVTSLVYFNGSTDYIEMYVIANGTPVVYGGNVHSTYINGFLARAA